jgi:hypothetical protein
VLDRHQPAREPAAQAGQVMVEVMGHGRASADEMAVDRILLLHWRPPRAPSSTMECRTRPERSDGSIVRRGIALIRWPHPQVRGAEIRSRSRYSATDDDAAIFRRT